MHEENKIRAQRIQCAATAIEPYANNIGEPDLLAADILADMRHYCDLHGLDFDDVNRRGQIAYDAEIEVVA